MRPQSLFPLFAEITSLSGIGPRLAKLFARLEVERVVDLLWHLPSSLVDRRAAFALADVPADRVVRLTLRVVDHQVPANRRAPYRVLCEDGTGRIALVFFNGREDYLRRLLPVGHTRLVSGRVELFGERLQMAHPDYVVAEDEAHLIPALEPVYPLTEGLSGKVVRKAAAAALAKAPELPEWLDPALVAERDWPAWRAALDAVHRPREAQAVEPDHPARARLAYDELLANQLALALVRQRARRRKGRALTGDGRLVAAALGRLPFELTGDQRAAVDQILADMGADDAMLRLVQGDVGSGKTVVALVAMLTAVEAGAQAAMLAPTEILARQHAAGLAPLAQAAGVRLAVLTGRTPKGERARLLADLAAGGIDILVGTHAVIEEAIQFKDLGLAVIDEQHRFGVFQRLALSGKGRAVDTLVMTATPIPRTLTLTVYGDMEVSRIQEKPPGRQPVDTRVVSLARLDAVVEAVGRAITQGEQVYWVCPLVEEAEGLDVTAAADRHRDLAARFGDRVGLLHGQLKGADKEAAMTAFADGTTRLLVATTVIEVGVDVPNATVMVIEHAERFGLAQLHQLRGRVGRGDKASRCLLLRAERVSETARARLDVLRRSDDGFLIAEEDLRLRGAGEVLGTRQSGLPQFRLADLDAHGELMARARDEARLILARDAELQGPRSAALRTLLYLFERDAAVRTLRSG
ncbi:ATP-dependent DNA helicase RecG [Rhodothalassium salexigens]|uniref:ATP-dependent DNA helicase RecG n=1 Tax=Rhodothalassium salexigens TaxID=1086 RepID=UPI001913F9AE|nr:ATP-dependent DNA helicase RecG [Rhodothalassium salexigens]MBK5919832.1 ATP-dependent DNA helicase RecG [Rhodothalassium salexigens]